MKLYIGMLAAQQGSSREIDMLNGSIWDKLPRYALPIAFTGMLEQLFNASDIAIVDNFANTNRTVARGGYYHMRMHDLYRTCIWKKPAGNI